MNENIQNTTPETPTEPPQYSWGEQKPTEESESPVMLRRKIKKGYGKAAMLIIWQQLFAIIIMVIISSVMSVKLTGAIMAENPEMSPRELTQAVTDGYTDETHIILSSLSLISKPLSYAEIPMLNATAAA